MGDVIKIIGHAAGFMSTHDGKYVKAMDFEANNGRGELETTSNVDEALELDDPVSFYRTQPLCHPVRETDGRPNRPLTAYTVQICTKELAKSSCI